MKIVLLILFAGFSLAPYVQAQRPSEARPLLIGDWPDPTICRVGDDFYMTHSSGPFRPAALIWHSRDLQNWKPLTHAIPQQEGNVWVSELTQHDGEFCLYYSANNQVYLTTAKAPAGPWSTPQPVEGVKTLDVGHIADDQGRRYLFWATGKVSELHADGTRVITDKKKVHAAWPIPAEWAIECECLESPRLQKRGEWYHMLAAQGGTFGPATAHMVISARAKHPLGPWENAPNNPLIHTYSRAEKWWTKGHGDLIQGPDGQWWCVLLAHKAQHRTLGRCTVIEPIEWTSDNWPRVAEKWPAKWKEAQVELPLSDEFNGPTLGLQWQFYRDLEPNRIALKEGSLRLEARGDSAGTSLPLCVMPRDECYQVETEFELDAGATAGMMLFASPEQHLGLALNGDGLIQRVDAGMKTYRWAKDLPHESRRVALRITNRHEDVTLSYQDAKGEWQTLTPAYAIDRWGDSLSGVRVGLFVHGKGRARFDAFRYQALSD